jgi:hypothetical protein
VLLEAIEHLRVLLLQEDTTFMLQCSFFEIYNEVSKHDLLPQWAL